MAKELERTLDGLLSRVGEGGAEGKRSPYAPDRLSDSDYFELDRLLKKASREGWPCGRNLTAEERERTRHLMSQMLAGGPGESRVEPWLLTDKDLDRMLELMEEGKDPRRGTFEPARLSPEEREEYVEVMARAMVGASQ